MMLALGTINVGPNEHLTIAPMPAVLDRKLGAYAFGLFEHVRKAAEARMPAEPHLEWVAFRAVENHGGALSLLGKGEQAVGVWQSWLDAHPTSSHYDRAEGFIKEELGLAQSHTTTGRERFAKGLKTCDDMDLRVGLSVILYRRLRVRGLAALEDVTAEVEKACRGNEGAKRYWSYLYVQMAIAAGTHGDCKRFNDYLARFQRAGGSTTDAAGYRSNFSKCPP
jgi:hypothetical protein